MKLFIVLFLLFFFPWVSFAQESEPGFTPELIPEVSEKTLKVENIKIVYPRRGCLNSTGYDSLSLISPLYKHFLDNRGSVSMMSSGFSAFSTLSEYFLLASDAADGNLLEKGLGTELEWEFVEEIPILIGPREVLFQYPFRGHFNWLSIVKKQTGKNKKFLTTHQKRASIFKASYQGKSLLKLKLKGVKEEVQIRAFSAIARVSAPDDNVNIYMIARRMGRGTRVKPLLEKELKIGNPRSNILLHFGGLASVDDLKNTDLCGSLLSHLSPMAGVPASQELALGKDALKAFDKKHGLHLIAANLVDNKTSKPIFRRFSVLEVEGLTVAVFGIVAKDELEGVAAEKRKDWKLLDTHLALKNAAQDLESQLQRKPDFSVVLLSSQKSTALSNISFPGIDLVLFSSGRMDLGKTKTELELDSKPTRFRYPFIPEGSSVGMNKVTIRFENGALNKIKHHAIPVDEKYPLDANIVEVFRKIERERDKKNAQILIPNIATLVRRESKLHALEWGPEIQMNGHVKNREITDPVQFTDPLWMRLVTNALKNELDTDVAISRNLNRSSNMIGPIYAWLVDSWLADTDRVGVVTLSGTELLKLWALLRKEEMRKEEGQLYAAGFEKEKPRVNGRKIIAENPYRVAITDHVATYSGFESVFKKKDIVWKFKNENGKFQKDAEGEFFDIKKVVYAHLEKWSGKNGSFEPNNYGAFSSLLLDDGSFLKPEYRLRIRDFALHGALYNNTENISTFSETRETRLTSPDNYTLGAKLDADFLFDGKLVGWETGIRAELSRIVIDVPGLDIPAQERADDILAFTETRINAVKVNVAEVGMPLIPFVRFEYDTEFTATQNFKSGANTTFPHQKLFNILLGAVLYPGEVLQEIRLAPIAQFDFSGEDLRTDFGARVAYKLGWNIAKVLKIESHSSISYLIPDSDDRSSDLSLRLLSKNQLVVPIWHQFSFFAFADLFYTSGKTNVNNGFGGSTIVGAGVKFSDIWRF